MLWKPNPGQAPQPLDKIASGGELSRFLLALAPLFALAVFLLLSPARNFTLLIACIYLLIDIMHKD